MAQKIVVSEVDDIDGSEAAEKVQFSLDNTDYEIDLSKGHADEMRAEMAAYIEKARKLPKGAKARRVRRKARPDLPDIRDYARARGYDIKDRGRVPERIEEEYDRLKSAGTIA